MIFYGFEDYKCCNVSAEILHLSDVILPDEWFEWGVKYLAGVPEEFIKDEELDIETILNLYKSSSIGKNLYVHSNCTIPRANIATKYKRKLKPEKADNCVIPDINNKHIYTKPQYAIFCDDAHKIIYIVRNRSRWDRGNRNDYCVDKCKTFKLGTTLKEINPKAVAPNSSEFEGILESKLIYCGNLLSFRHDSELFIMDLINGKLHDVIQESELLPTLGDSNNELTKEIYDSIKGMLKSSDMDTVALALKLLSELNYEKYRNSVIHLLTQDSFLNWSNIKSKNSTGIKYMLKYLNLWNSFRVKYTENTTQEDFDLMNEILSNYFNDYIESAKDSFNATYPFADIDFNYTVTIKPKL